MNRDKQKELAALATKLAVKWYGEACELASGYEAFILIDTTICRMIAALSSSESITMHKADEWEGVILERVNSYHETACQMAAEARRERGAEPYLADVAPQLAYASDAQQLRKAANEAFRERGLQGVVDVLKGFGAHNAAAELRNRYLAGS